LPQAEVRFAERAPQTLSRVARETSAARSRVDFESEARDAQRALHDLELITALKDRDIRAAHQRWEAAVSQAVGKGEPEQAVADAARITVRELRAIVRRAGTL
jgi:hypothetical protein